MRQYPELNSLIPAVVTEVREKEATAALQNGQIIIIPWEGMSWARPALKRGGWVGKSPTKAQQVVAAGDIIYVHPTEKSWQLAQIPEAESAMVAMNQKMAPLKFWSEDLTSQKVNSTELPNPAGNQAPVSNHLFTLRL